jgi:hypothetical protein
MTTNKEHSMSSIDGDVKVSRLGVMLSADASCLAWHSSCLLMLLLPGKYQFIAKRRLLNHTGSIRRRSFSADEPSKRGTECGSVLCRIARRVHEAAFEHEIERRWSEIKVVLCLHDVKVKRRTREARSGCCDNVHKEEMWCEE